MTDRRVEGHFEGFDEFATAVNDPGFSTPYIFYRANYGNVLPTTPGDFTCATHNILSTTLRVGERLLSKYTRLSATHLIWNNSLLLVTYDEQGGFFDHVPRRKRSVREDPIFGREQQSQQF